MSSHQVTFDPESDGTVVVAIVHTVADALDTDPADLPSISDCIDPDALNTLYSKQRYSEYPWIKFTYAGFLVTIDSTRRIKIQRR